MMDTIAIREIREEDNNAIRLVVRKVLEDIGAPKVGTAYEDEALNDLTKAYQKEKAIYFVVELNGEIMGGGGIAHLQNADFTVCELQKMYFLTELRGKGVGTQLIKKCLDKAKEFGFKSCYLETMPYMEAAQKLYKKNGFSYLEKPMGGTGHYSCPVWMIKTL